MKTKGIPIVLLVIAVAVVMGIKKKSADPERIGCENGLCTLPIPQDELRPAGVIKEEHKETPLPKLLDLGAGKCVPCKMMEPILEELTEAYAGKLNVEFIDVWENEGVSEKYGIRMIPTQIFYDAEGNELFRHEGFYSKEDILARWAELGINLSNE
jgi:thioredoxin 1